VKRKAAKKAHGLSAPGLLAPANRMHVQQLPTLTWNAVSGASEYEYQVAADPKYHSIVLGTGVGLGSTSTYNLAASLAKPVTDGTYYWRVRALTSKKEPGPWSGTRTIVKAWTEAPQLQAPAENAAITWPSVPLVLNWTPVSSAREYVVTIATDKELSHIVLGSATSPQKTWASAFALPGTLPAGQYYWQVTPLDAEGHRGTPSAVRSFTWSWPTTTTTALNDLTTPNGFQPQFSWAPIPGADHYEVEVNQSPQFPLGSRWCCGGVTTGTSLTPTEVLANDHAFYWRVRAIDASGNAGVWNYGAGEHGNPGEGFTEAFDNAAPSVPNLHMTEPNGSEAPNDPTTNTPIVTWSAVPGAASYEVQVTTYVSGNGCNWAASELADEKQAYETSSLAWTPIADLTQGTNHIGPEAWPKPFHHKELIEGNKPYCVRVLARSAKDAKRGEVVSTWTQINGLNKPAFNFASQPAPGIAGPNGLETQAGEYILPASGSITPRTPLLTWNRVPGASFYYVVIARDAGFTDVVDVAETVVPAYAPELEPGGEEPLADQTNAYYWAVVPSNAKGEVFSEPPMQDAPQSFTKFSVPPTPESPVNGARVEDQPSFQWTQAEGAENYTLQVSADPSFGNLLDNVRTDSTSYTSSTTYPADVTLYWRVRGNDANVHAEGLNWSPVQVFERTLPKASPAAGNATSGEAIPVLSWSPVPGAIGYGVHVEQPDGSTKDFSLDSTSFTVQEWDGPGVWRWQTRPVFPTETFQTVPGGYFSPQAFTHTLGPPAGAQGVKSGSRIVISWGSEAYAKEYEVQISTTDTFSSTLETHRTEQSSWAPNLNLNLPANRGTIHWRVAALDNRYNVGPWATGSFVPPRPACTVKKVKRGKHTVKVCVAKKKKKKHG
jgi:hypothetical protein